jgi:hypothetical protein
VTVGLVVAAALAAVAPAAGQCEQTRLTASDAAAQDRFGISVGLSGDLAVVGSRLDDTQATDAGAAYVFRFDGASWAETEKLTASDGGPGDQLGISVAASGDRVIVGAWLDDDNGEDAGAAYVFRFDGKGWSQEAKLLPDDGAGGDQFGNAVDIDGEVAIVGSASDDDAGQSSGAAYVFRYAAGEWSQEQKLIPAAFSPGDQVGVAVALDGALAVVTAPGTDDQGTQSGSAFVFRRTGGTWTEEQEIRAGDGRTGDFFGNDADVAGDVIVVGAVFDDGPAGIDAGSAYVFRYEGAAWAQEQKLTADDAADGDRFGSEVAIDGETILAGAPQEDQLGDGAGAAYFFRPTGSDPDPIWTQSVKIAASDGAATDEFGGAVAASGDRAIVGAALRQHGEADATGTGAAYLFVGVLAIDCNENGVSDVCDIADGTSEDFEQDGIPDECQCPEDIDDSGVVDFADVLIVLTAWGPCNPGRCPEDLNGDGMIGFADVLMIIVLWGPCE